MNNKLVFYERTKASMHDQLQPSFFVKVIYKQLRE